MRIDLTVRGPDARDVDLALLVPPEGTVGEVLPAVLAAAGCPNAEPVCCDGVPVDLRRPAAEVLRTGSLISVSGREPVRPRGSMCVQVVGGESAGVIAELDDAVLIGRDEPCDLILSDPQVSRRHARIEANVTGIRVHDLASTNGTWVDGRRTECAALGPESLVRVGDSFLRVGPVTAPRPVSTRHVTEPIRMPEVPVRARAGRMQWLALVVPAVGGLVMGWLMHSTLFVVMAAVMPLGALAGWGGERWQARRTLRREQVMHRAQIAEAEAAVKRELLLETQERRAADPDPVTLTAIAASSGAQLWSRDRASPELLRVRIGLGREPARLQLEQGGRTASAGEVRDVPVCVDLGQGPLTLHGPGTQSRAVASWCVLQLATYCAPDAVRFVPVIHKDAGWQWLRWLPGMRAPEPLERTLAHLAEEVTRRRERGWDGSWIVLVVDRTAARDFGSELAALLRGSGSVGVTALCVDPPDDRLQTAGEGLVATVEVGSRLRISGHAAPVVADAVSEQWADGVARALAACRATDVDADESVSLGPLVGPLDASEVRSRWSADRGSADAVIGRSGREVFEVDLDRDGPHALVAGTTGAGKSELLRTWVAALAVAHPPTAVTFLLVDYKGGAAFGACDQLPHVLGVVTDLDTSSVRRALASLGAELRRREALFAACGVDDWAAYRATRPEPPLPRLVLVVDEFASLAAELPDFVHGLVSIAQRGRSLGIHLILATQRPGGSVSPEIRANTALRIALRTTTASESLDVIDSPLAERLDPNARGSGYARRGSALVGFRAAYAGSRIMDDDLRVVALGPWRSMPTGPVPATGPSELDRVVDSVTEAWRGQPSPRRPWLPPLPGSVPLASLPPCRSGAPIGLADLPSEQRQAAAEWDMTAGGSVLVVGGSGSGRSTALVTIAAAAARHCPGDLELYAIAPTGSPVADLTVLPELISYLDLDEIALPERFLSRFAAELELRRQEPTRSLAMLLLDGWEEFAAADEATGRCTALLLRIVRMAAAAGLTVVVSGDRGALTPRVAAAFATRYVLPLTDPADYPLAGISPPTVPSVAVPGRAIRVRDGVEMQFAHLGSAPDRHEARRELADLAARSEKRTVRPDARPVLVRRLPWHVTYTELSPATEGPLVVHLGVGGDAAAPVTVDLAAGRRRLLVAGPPRSGRTTTLRAIAAQLQGDVRGVVAAPPGSPLATIAAARSWPMLTPLEGTPGDVAPDIVLIDDLEQFRDTAMGDLLAGWGAEHSITIVAAGRSTDLASDYRGLGAALRRAGCVLLLQPAAADGTLAGITLPRQPPVTTPGRGILVPDPAWLAPGKTIEPTPIQVVAP